MDAAALALLAGFLLLALAVGVPRARRPVVYIAAPFAPCDGLSAEENTARAQMLADRYRAAGYRVVCVHPDILAGRYGDDADPVQREAGMRRTLALVVEVALAGGVLACLHKPGGGPSSGMRMELAAYLGAGGAHPVRWWRFDALGRLVEVE